MRILKSCIILHTHHAIFQDLTNYAFPCVGKKSNSIAYFILHEAKIKGKGLVGVFVRWYISRWG